MRNTLKPAWLWGTRLLKSGVILLFVSGFVGVGTHELNFGMNWPTGFFGFSVGALFLGTALCWKALNLSER